jgi:putative transposase
MSRHSVPSHILSDNGSEFIAEQMQNWLVYAELDTLYIEPGAPWQNGYAKSFNSRFRDEFLEMNHFTTLIEAQQLAKRRQQYYNERRSHTSPDNRTPKEFSEHCLGGSVMKPRNSHNDWTKIWGDASNKSTGAYKNKTGK